MCIIEPLKPQRSQKIVCARSVVLADHGSTVCRVLNPTDTVIWLSKRRPLASAEMVLADDIFDEPLSRRQIIVGRMFLYLLFSLLLLLLLPLTQTFLAHCPRMIILMKF